MQSLPYFQKVISFTLALRPSVPCRPTDFTSVSGQIKDKDIFLFGTAGFGGSAEYFKKILTAVEKYIDSSNTVIGSYMCQGRMPQSVRERYIKMKNSPLPIPNIDKMIENFDNAVSHPDETDLQRLKDAVAHIKNADAN